MILRKKNVTVAVTHPADIARYKRVDYEEVTDAPPVEEKAEDIAAIQQEIVEEVIQPTKRKGKVKDGS